MFESIKKLFAKPIAAAANNASTQKTTADHPLVIKDPCLGLLNLAGEAGNNLLLKDVDDLGSLFPGNVNLGLGQVPRCNVLFLYCSLEPSGRVVGQSFTLRDVIRAAGAHIAVVASEIDLQVLKSKEFAEFLGSRGDWPANIVVTGNRNGDTFGKFFQKLFGEMRNGVTMPLAWVSLAPQGPKAYSDCPGTIFLMAGHITFKTAKLDHAL